ncbi:MAG: DNA gyrase subunit A [Nanoarchaeota archaeon]|nr:DNA gyrase subunit A [Nanoarchaeota archaeon]MBU1031183.1 DNA gyrase subunit A [Nanoarchaeota archaeon]
MSEEKEQKTAQRIIPRVIEDEMKIAYLDYAMSVIVGRALPDVRDGLKPVHRRILFAMNDIGLKYSGSHKKCARIVGEVLGKYHPHGDSAVYDSLVRMAQTFSLRYPFINGQGNFGSIDGDNAAAMRYTEAKLAKISDEMLQDIDKETVDFIDNFDGSLKEPVVLPSKLPSLLINGSSGIAVGMATNIPPHNIREVVEGLIAFLENPDIGVLELMEFIKGPDFPTGGVIAGRKSIIDAYSTGRGKIILKGKVELEEKKDRQALIITEVPYMINKSLLVEEIAKCVHNKSIEGISDLRDESDRNGIRVVVSLKKNTNVEVVKNQLFKHTRLQVTFGAIMIALVNNEPKTLTLKELLENYLLHRKEVVTKRTTYDLKKAEARAHILEGLKIALKNINAIIKTIKSADSVDKARTNLILEFSLSKEQTLAILDMKLQKLAKLEQDKIINEYNDLLKKIKELKEILADKQKILEIIKSELKEVSETFGDKRRTEISDIEEDMDIEDLIVKEDVVVSITHAGYIKRMPIETYKLQRRGGKGVIGATMKEEDFIEHLFVANTHSYLLIFTTKGKLYWLKVYRIPESDRYSKGKPLVNFLEVESDEKVTAVIPVDEFDEKQYLFMATKKGIIKKTKLDAYSNVRKGGIRAINLDDNDSLIAVKLTDGSKKILLATKKGYAVKFDEKDARPLGRVCRGVRGVTLRSGRDDALVDVIIADEGENLLTITENGYGKKTPISEYRLIKRGGKGVINIKCTERNGDVVAVNAASDDDELMFISRDGIIIRTSSSDISTISRNTQGVRLMRLSNDDVVVSAAKIITDEDEPSEKI